MLKLSFSLCRRLTTWRRDVQVALAHGTLIREADAIDDAGSSHRSALSLLTAALTEKSLLGETFEWFGGWDRLQLLVE